MAKRKQKHDIDIKVDEPAQAPAAEPVAAGQPEPPVEKALPELTVRIFPVRKAKSKLRATANVNIAGAFAVQGFRIFDSRNGLFVKEPERTYIKDGTELSQSVFFPITSVIEEMLPADVPVVFARDPISKVQSDLGGGSNYLTSYGVTRINAHPQKQ